MLALRRLLLFLAIALLASGAPATAAPVVDFDPVTGTLTVTADAAGGPLEIRAAAAGGPVNLNGAPVFSPAAAVQRLAVNGAAGDDRIIIDELVPGAFANLVAVLARGNEGNDVAHVVSFAAAGFPLLATLDLGGGSGNDNLAAGDNGAAFASLARIDLSGDAGDDLLFIVVVGSNTPIWPALGVFHASGGPGRDEMVTQFAPNGQPLPPGLVSDFSGDEDDDVIVVTHGRSLLTGGPGNDFIGTGAGEDVVAAGEGDDFVGFIVGTGGNDSVDGGPGNDRLGTGSGNDTLVGGPGDDTLFGNAGDDTLSGTSGTDRLDGGTGDNLLLENGGTNFSLTDARLVRTAIGIDNLVPNTIQRAQLTASGQNSYMDARGFSGPVTMQGGTGNDQLFGGPNDDTLRGGGGRDLVQGGPGNDTVEGEAGPDGLQGNEGNDQVRGGDDDDTLGGGPGDDTLDGGADVNRVAETGNVDFTLTDESLTGLGADTLIDIQAASLTGGAGPNRLDGSQATIPLSFDGSAGNDTLLGGTASDRLNGGPGDDLLVSGGGSDALLGGGGIDRAEIALLGAEAQDVAITPNSVAVGGGAQHSYAAIRVLLVTGGAGPDRFAVRPSAVTTIGVDGGEGNPAANELVVFSPTGAARRQGNQILVPGAQPVAFARFGRVFVRR